MLSVLLAIAQKAEQSTVFSLLATTSVSVLALPFLKQARRKLLFNWLLKRSSKSGRRYGRTQPWLKTLLFILGGVALIGLLFSWTIALWVVIGVAILIPIGLIYAAANKGKKPRFIKIRHKDGTIETRPVF